MDNLDYSEETAKVSDSAYSNSCSNSQSITSRSSKSTHSGSNSSGSSGYRGKPSTSGGRDQPQPKRLKAKEPKKKKQFPADTVETRIKHLLPGPVPKEPPPEELRDVDQTPSPQFAHLENYAEQMDFASPEDQAQDDGVSCSLPAGNTPVNSFSFSKPTVYCSTGFSCVISMHDGVVMYTTPLRTTTLGFPKDMWVGRSFIDFIHPKDRKTFASQISRRLAVPKTFNIQTSVDSVSTMVCRIRRYRRLGSGFCVKEKVVTFMPFLLKFSFKRSNVEEGNIIYLVVQATPYFSAFKVPNEILVNPKQFVMRHAASGALEYIDHESVPYLGYIPQDVFGKDALKLYHPDDMCYMGQVYATIVKEGGLSKSKPYRMRAQNDDYVKLETEWSSFINPWSRKLEFVVGKHSILEGPSNPDVLQAVETPDKTTKANTEEMNKQQAQRDRIVKKLNEVLTNSAEKAKLQTSKRCQDLATFMGSLIEEPPKVDVLRLEIPDVHNYYEPDSMLGSISPHHDFKDSKSPETPLSYNQLNYNENLQRYFDSHQPNSQEDLTAVIGENALGFNDYKPMSSTYLSPSVPQSADFSEVAGSCESELTGLGSSTGMPCGDHQSLRLTESLLTKHNSDMEKELIRVRREMGSNCKAKREKTCVDYKQKKKEHLARCNASFRPAAVPTASVLQTPERKAHGVKRPLEQDDTESVAHKIHCSTQRQKWRPHVSSSQQAANSTTRGDNLPAASHWHPNQHNNAFILGVIPQPMPIISPVMPGMIPMYYTPATPMTPTNSGVIDPNKVNSQLQPPTMPCMMYGQPVYGSPLVYSPIATQVAFPVQQPVQFTNTLHPHGLASSNYEEDSGANSSSIASRRKLDELSSDLQSSTLSCSFKSTEAVPGSESGVEEKLKTLGTGTRTRTSDEAFDRTDVESSYSSFYSSVFRTDSGSAEDSSDQKKRRKGLLRTTSSDFWSKTYTDDQSSVEDETKRHNYVPKRKMKPPWMEQVSVTSELIYKYQMLTKSMEEVLLADKQKISKLTQPPLVDEQLGQLYLDLQLQGVASRLTLEEGVTSSSSCGEETSFIPKQGLKRKREYSKLMMIYEEDAPLPPPFTDDEMKPFPTTFRIP